MGLLNNLLLPHKLREYLHYCSSQQAIKLNINGESNMDIIIKKSQQVIPQVVWDALGAVGFLFLLWGCSYLFLLLG